MEEAIWWFCIMTIYINSTISFVLFEHLEIRFCFHWNMKMIIGNNSIGVVLVSFKWLGEEGKRISLERDGKTTIIQVVKFKQQL